MLDPYSVLGVSRDASMDEIKKAMTPEMKEKLLKETLSNC